MDNMLTWNVRNWITVVLMFLLAWFVILAGGQFLLNKKGLRQSSVGAYSSIQQQVGQAG